MPHRSQLSDYEPLTRSRPKRESTVEAEDRGWNESRPSKKGVFGPEAEGEIIGSAWRRRTRVNEKPGGSTQVPTGSFTNQLNSNWIIRRGHLISYAGLLLFTFVLYFRPYEWGPSMTWLSSSAYWIAFSTLVVFIPSQLGLENNITARPREVNLVLLVLAASLLSIPFSVDPMRGWDAFTEYLKVVLMFIVMVNVLRTEKRLRGLLILILIASCVLSLSAMYDYTLGILALKGERIQGLIGGLFQNPNDLALHLVTVIPIAIALVLASRGLIRKVTYGTCALLCAAGLVATFSRGGFVGFAAAGAVLIFRLSKRSKMLVIVVLPIILGLFILLAPGDYGARLATTSDGSALARQDDLKRSLYLAIRHPLLGVGMDNYVIYSNSQHATHNAYTQVAAELGIPAAVFYVMFLVLPLKELRRISRETSAQRSRYYYLSVGLEASLIGYMVSSFFASVAFIWYAYYLVAYALCVRRLHQVEAAENPT